MELDIGPLAGSSNQPYAILQPHECKDLQTAIKALIAAFVKQAQSETPLPEVDLIQTIWQGFVSSVDWSAARPDQLEGLVVKELTVSESNC